MKKLVGVFSAFMVVLIFTGLTDASLVGDDVVIGHHGPTINDVAASDTATVATGNGDVVTLGTFSVDMEADSLTVAFNTNGVFFDIRPFNGLVVSDLDDDGGSDYILLNVVVDTDVADWNESRIILGDDFVAFNWQKLTFNTTTNFEAMLEFGPNPIPIPTTMVLFITGLVGFAAARKYRTTHSTRQMRFS